MKKKMNLFTPKCSWPLATLPPFSSHTPCSQANTALFSVTVTGLHFLEFYKWKHTASTLFAWFLSSRLLIFRVIFVVVSVRGSFFFFLLLSQHFTVMIHQNFLFNCLLLDTWVVSLMSAIINKVGVNSAQESWYEYLPSLLLDCNIQERNDQVIQVVKVLILLKQPAKKCSKVTVPFWIPMSNDDISTFSTSLPRLGTVSVKHFNKCAMGFHCDLIFTQLMTTDVEHLFPCANLIPIQVLCYKSNIHVCYKIIYINFLSILLKTGSFFIIHFIEFFKYSGQKFFIRYVT